MFFRKPFGRVAAAPEGLVTKLVTRKSRILHKARLTLISDFLQRKSVSPAGSIQEAALAMHGAAAGNPKARFAVFERKVCRAAAAYRHEYFAIPYNYLK
jgi:hypothetical protein